MSGARGSFPIAGGRVLAAAARRVRAAGPRLLLPLLTGCVLTVAAAGTAAAVPDPVVPFPVRTYACDDVVPPDWPVTDQDPWCGTWNAGATTPQIPDDLVVPSLGRIALVRVGAGDARALLLHDAVNSPAFPPLTGLAEGGFASNTCNQMLAEQVTSTRYYLGTFESGDERGYVGACSDLWNFPRVLNGGYVSQTSADPAIDRWQRVRRRGNFSIQLWPGSQYAAEGEMAPIFSEFHPGATWWDFEVKKEPRKPAVPAGAPPGQPPIYGRPLYRVMQVAGAGVGLDSSANRKHYRPRPGWLLGTGDVINVRDGDAEPPGTSRVTLQRLRSDGAVAGEVVLTPLNADLTDFIAGESVPSLSRGEAETKGDVGIRTPPAEVQPGGGSAMALSTATSGSPRARIIYDPRTKVARIADRAGSVRVVPTNANLTPVVLSPGQEVRVGMSFVGSPFALVPDDALANLAATIPAPRVIRAGPATVTAPGRMSLRALAHSKCVRVAVRSSRAARVLVTIFSGRRSIRLFGQRLVRFTAPGLVTTCILVPRHARTFHVRTPLRLAVGWALGARGQPGQRPARPVIRPIRLVP